MRHGIPLRREANKNKARLWELLLAPILSLIVSTCQYPRPFIILPTTHSGNRKRVCSFYFFIHKSRVCLSDIFAAIIVGVEIFVNLKYVHFLSVIIYNINVFVSAAANHCCFESQKILLRKVP